MRVLLALLLSAAPAVAAGQLAEAVSYTKPVGDRFVYAQLGRPEIEQDDKLVKSPADREAFRQLRAKYPQSGLYRPSGELVWALDDGSFAFLDNVFVSADGRKLVRIEGEWWRTKDFTGGRVRLPADVEKAQLDGPGLSFFADGKLVKRYTVRELVPETDALPHTPQHVLWASGGLLTDDGGRFVLFTQSPERLAFDAASGELLERKKVGLGNPLLTGILVACGVLTVAVAGVWAYLAFLRGRRVAGGAGGVPANPAT